MRVNAFFCYKISWKVKTNNCSVLLKLRAEIYKKGITRARIGTPQKEKEKEKNMKDKIFAVLQRVGRSFMLPIAILPVAGLLLGVGGSLTNETMLETYGLLKVMGPGTIFNAIFTVMKEAGDIVFANLPIIFAMGVAIGMAKKEKEVKE